MRQVVAHTGKSQIIPTRHVPAHGDKGKEVAKPLEPVIRSRNGAGFLCFLVVASNVLADGSAIRRKVGPLAKFDQIKVKDLPIYIETRQVFQIEVVFDIPVRPVLVGDTAEFPCH